MNDAQGSSVPALIAAIAAVSIAGAGLSLSIPLISLRMEDAGYSGEANGAGIAIAGLATLVFAPLVPRLAAWSGIRLFLVACLILSIASLFAFAATASDLRLWFPLRGIYSCALTGLFVASEFAVNALAPPARRGVWVGIYSTSLSVGFAAGPLVLRVTGHDGIAPFAAGALLFVVASIPIFAAGGSLPVLPAHGQHSPFAFLRRAPGLMSAAFVFGAIETSAMGLLPVQAVRNGLDAETGAVFVAALAIGNVLFQIPIGLLSDRFSRPLLLLGATVIAAGGGVLLAGLADTVSFLPLLVVWSGVTSGLYMIGLAELGGRYEGSDLAAANAAFVLCYASGMVIAPPIIGRAVDAAPSVGLFLSLAACAAVSLAVQLVRRRASAR